MRITAKFLEARVDTVNGLLGFQTENVKWSTVGAVRLSHAYGGYAVHRVCNESGGVSDLTGGHGSGREAAAFLGGMIEALRITKAGA